MELKKRILIIEDEALIALFLKKQVEEMGYEVVGVCQSGEEALEFLKSNKVEMLLVDIQLDTEMTGIDLVKQVKEDRDIAVIYITSNTDSYTLEGVKETMPHGFIKKPVDNNQLRWTIDFSFHKFFDEVKMKKLTKTNKRNKHQIEELNDTTKHLATATLRERDLKKELQKTLDELEESKKIIEIQNKRILDSINYAERIQKAIIPKLEDIRKDFPKTDWFYKPKDVVSGDFPYYYKKGDLIYFAAVDCTGHGVPGAMMSLIGHLILNGILNDETVYSPAEVLLKLHQGVVRTLKQDHPGNKAADGMDVAICCYNTKTKKLEYSGAHRPLYLVRKGVDEIIQYKGGKYPIGGNQYGGKNSFPNHEVDLMPNDKVYFFSDGYPDQFGGENDLKIGPKRIRKMLEENAGKSVDENIKLLTDKFDDWMGKGKQMDDVLLIGIEF